MAAAAAGCSRQDRGPSFAADPFALGVASGDPGPDGFVLWTRLAPDPLNGGGIDGDVGVRWEIASDDAFRQVVRSGTATASAELAHSVHVEVAGLEADRWYWYRFSAGDAVSATGRARTMPTPEAMPDRLSLAFASCQHYETGFYTAYEHMAAEHPDLVFHLGDYIYEGAARPRVRAHRGEELASLEDYRNRYALYRTDPDLQLAHAACKLARRRIRANFRAVFRNDDTDMYKVARGAMGDRYDWLEKGVIHEPAATRAAAPAQPLRPEPEHRRVTEPVPG